MTENFQQGDLSSAVKELLSNDSIGDQLRGFSWAERTESYVSIDSSNSNDLVNSINFLILELM